MEVFALTKENFGDQINHGITLVQFYTPGCEACQEQQQIAEELAQEVRHQAVIVKVNSEQETELAAEYGITSAPTSMLFKEGYKVETLIGLQSKEVLRQTILRYAALGDTC